jgi:spore coat polysaccharide biosynthesis protein SpsF
MHVLAVVQARAGSTRLPGKVLATLGDRPVLEWVVRAARAAGQIDGVVVATSGAPADDDVAAACERLGVPCVRGSEDDVLGRFVQVLHAHPADAVVRLTADCPLHDPRLIDAVVGAWRAAPSYDYVSTVLVRTLPRGLDVELATADALRRADRSATGYDRVHVTSSLYADPLTFSCLGICVTPDGSDLRMTLDTADDLAALRAVVAVLGDHPVDHQALVALLRSRPDLVALNSGVVQKPIEAG